MKKYTLWVLVAIVIVAAGIGGYMTLKHQQTEPRVQNTPTVTAIEKNYIDSSAGFQLQYPTDWTYDYSTDDPSYISRTVIDVIDPATGQRQYSEGTGIFQIFAENGTASSVYAATKDDCKQHADPNKIFSYRSLTIAGKSGWEVNCAGEYGSDYTVTIVPYGTAKTLEIRTGYKDSVHAQILSTLKFAASAQTSWKTYRNDKHGIVLQYPQALKPRISEDTQEYFSADFSGTKSAHSELGFNVTYGDSKISGLSPSTDDCVKSARTVTVNSVQWTLADYICGTGSPNDYYTKAAYLKHGSQAMQILSQDEDYLKQILATIRLSDKPAAASNSEADITQPFDRHIAASRVETYYGTLQLTGYAKNELEKCDPEAKANSFCVEDQHYVWFYITATDNARIYDWTKFYYEGNGLINAAHQRAIVLGATQSKNDTLGLSTNPKKPSTISIAKGVDPEKGEGIGVNPYLFENLKIIK
jgi:hypothetical protein